MVKPIAFSFIVQTRMEQLNAAPFLKRSGAAIV